MSLFDGLDARTTALLIIALGVTIFLLQYMQALLAPLAFGLLLFYALDPAVDALERAPRAALDRRRARARRDAGDDPGRRLCAAGRGDDGHQRAAGRRAPHLGARRAPAAAKSRVRSRKSSRRPRSLRRPIRPNRTPGVVRVQVEEPRVTATGSAVVGIDRRVRRAQSARS